MITLGQFRRLTDALADDLPLLLPAPDHSHRKVQQVCAGTALYDVAHNILSEDYGEESTPEADYGTRIRAVLIY